MKYSNDLIEEIITALDNADYEMRYYFNKNSLEIRFIFEHSNEEEEEVYRDEWIEINGIESFRKYNLMEEFASQQQDRLKEILYYVLRGKSAFRRFKDVLLNFPEAEKEWFEFEHEWLKRQAIDFLDGNC